MSRTVNIDDLLPMKEAQRIILSTFPNSAGRRMVPLTGAIGSILAEPVISKRTMPPVMLTGPDGIAVRSEETKSASPDNPLVVTGMKTNTGLPVPTGYDAVIAIEEIKELNENSFLITAPAAPLENTISPGSDIREGEELLPKGHYLNPFDVAALHHYGIRQVPVKTWKVGLIATGDEIVPISKEPLVGQILDTNSLMIAGYLNQYGVLHEIYPILPDDPELVSSRIIDACETCDMVLVFGGSSAGTKDITVDAMEKSGDLLFHGVAMGPGKPVSWGRVNGKPVVGMPGPSIGSLVTFFQLILPLLKSWGVPVPKKKTIVGEMTGEVKPFFNHFDLFSLVNVRYDNGKTMVQPMERRAGQSMGLKADAILHVPRKSGGFKKGDTVTVTLIHDRNVTHGCG